MSLNFISAGIFFNWITNFILVFFLMKSDYEINHLFFSFLLLGNLFIWSMIIGRLSSKYDLSGRVNGLFVGMGSAVILFLVLFLFSPPHFNTNVYLCALWIFVGAIGGWFGSFLNLKKWIRKKALA